MNGWLESRNRTLSRLQFRWIDDLWHVFSLLQASRLDENNYRRAGAPTLAIFKKAMACSRVTLGNEFRNTSRLSPASKWSSSAWTGTLVPLNTGVPLNTSGERLTTCAAVFATDTVSFYLVSLWHWTEGCPPYLQTSKGCVNQLALRQKPVTSPVPAPHPCGRGFHLCLFPREGSPRDPTPLRPRGCAGRDRRRCPFLRSCRAGLRASRHALLRR